MANIIAGLIPSVNDALSIVGNVTVLFTREYNFPSYGGVSFDAVLTESHQYSSKITSYPVESGSTIVDNVIKTPTVVRMRTIVSDSPLSFYSNQRNGQTLGFSNNFGFSPNPITTGVTGLRSITAMEALIAAQEQRIPLTLVTGIRVYRNMILTNMNVPRDSNTGKCLFFELEFTEVLLATVLVNALAFEEKNIRTVAKKLQFQKIVTMGAQGLQAVNPFIRTALAAGFSVLQSVFGRFFRSPF